MSGSRCLSIDVLRLFFAVIIVLHHSRYVLGDENSLFLGGSLAVEFYFFVSGYLLLSSVRKAGERPEGIGSETLHFILRKIRTILPEFLISWIIGFVFVCFAEQYSLKEAAHEFLRDFWELSLVKMSGLFVHGINGVMWYLSAMLLCMAVLYPLLRTHQDLMTHLVCPLLALFCYGYLCRTQNHPRDPVVWLGIMYKGLLRALAGLSAGVVAHMAADRMRRKAPRGLTRPGIALMTAAEVVCLVLPVRYMALHKPGEQDYFYMFLLLLLVLLCFSGLGTESAHPKASSFLSRYSLALYLSHLYFTQHINSILPEEVYSGAFRLAVCLLLSFANGLLVMALSSLWRRKRSFVRSALGRMLLR